MTLFATAPWLPVVGSFLLAAVVMLAGKAAPRSVPYFASVGPVLVILAGLGGLAVIPPGSTPSFAPWTSVLAVHGSMQWFSAGAMSLPAGWAVDSLAACMLLVVGVVALMVMVFSAGYMAGDPGWSRYYALLCLFTGSMTLLVVGDSFVTLFIGWELVGACSYLLIGFWYEKPSAVAAAIKAFLTTRVGDIGLLLGIALLWKATGTLSYEGVMHGIEAASPGLITAAAICLAIGAIGKSAQFPLHIWLPDAMEGPTPVSALIHAATMVAAGVFLVARTWPLFEAAPAARSLLLFVGVVSALGAALIALVQRDIKKVLAYSTISQLGFMFAALGAGAWEVAFFHLVAHAAFKALLFLASGSVIHGSGTQDLAEMGGLRKTMPVTFAVWLIGGAALVGIPPLAGFFSKDAVLDVVWVANPVAGGALFVAAVLTGYYTVRATKLAFFGEWRGKGHSHESPLSMLVPLVVLAVPAAGLGFGARWFAERLSERYEALSLPLSAAAVVLALAGAVYAWVTVRDAGPDTADATGVVRVLRTGFSYDAAVQRFIVQPVATACRVLWAIVDRFLIDGIVEGSAIAASAVGGYISKLQSGDGQGYAALIAVATVLILAFSILVRW
jgi:NADH-quinone oxidoreductase subunit L